MIFFQILSFLFFMNLCNSFKFINDMNHKTYNKLSMGCDYYIEHNLFIYYNDNTSSCINFNRQRGYYSDFDNFIMDIKSQDTKMSKWEKMKQYHLTPREIPYLIYSNHSFTNIYVSKQYKEMLEFEIINKDYKTWDDVTEVVILEERYERD